MFPRTQVQACVPTDEPALKLLFLVLNLAAKEWRMPARE